MKIDTYSKSILTIIAVCLVWICLRDLLIKPVVASAPNEVIITGVTMPEGSGIPVILKGIKQGEWTINERLGNPQTQKQPWQPINVVQVSSK